MGKYSVQANQSIYDIAIHINGSIEGITDLLMLNDWLSISSELKSGDILEYTDNLFYNESVVRYFKNNKIIPSNGALNVNHKEPSYPLLAILCIPSTMMQVLFSIQGAGQLQIDWNDNSNMQSIQLSESLITYQHSFNSILSQDEKRIVKIYGSASITNLNLSETKATDIYFLDQINIEDYMNTFSKSNLDYVELMNGVYSIDISNWNASSILPLVKNTALMNLNISSQFATQPIIDEYLIALVKNYGTRRNCHITLSTQPSGIYQEPMRDENLEYVIASGMEAVWVLTHEEAWNEGGPWIFTINNTTYQI